MPVYILRLNDGTCLVGEADSETQAREEFVSRWVDSEMDPELILSVRELPKNTFLSKWWLAEFPADQPMLTQLDGQINENTDIFENEYPAIEAVHNRAHEESQSLSKDDPLFNQKFDNWSSSTERKLRDAVRMEKSRGNELTRSVQ